MDDHIKMDDCIKDLADDIFGGDEDEDEDEDEDDDDETDEETALNGFSILNVNDFQIPNDVDHSTVRDWFDKNINCKDKHLRLQKKKGGSSYNLYEIYCQCSGEFDRQGIAVQKHKDSFKVDCPVKNIWLKITPLKDDANTCTVDDTKLKIEDLVHPVLYGKVRIL